MELNFGYNERPVTMHGLDGDHIANVIRRTRNFYEIKMLEWIAGLRLAGTVVDVGANIGNHTVFFGLFTAADRVLAVEPYHLAADLLRRNIAANNLGGKAVQITCALGATNSRTGILPGKKTNIGTTKVREGADVELRRLDDLAAGEPVSLIKIDVEGYEVEVLRGAVDVLTSQGPLLFIEASSLARRRRLDNFLKPFGYSRGQRFNRTPTYLYSKVDLSSQTAVSPRESLTLRA